MTNKKCRTYYNEKAQAVGLLVELKRKPESKDFKEIANKLDVPQFIVKKAWEVFQESGGKLVDRRETSFGKGARFTANTKVFPSHPTRYVSAKERAKIILEYMNSSLNSRELCDKYKISVNQFYGWIRELNVSGTVSGGSKPKKILDYTKYAKVEIKDVIWLKKKPNTTRQTIISLTPIQIEAYTNVGSVLERYLNKLLKK